MRCLGRFFSNHKFQNQTLVETKGHGWTKIGGWASMAVDFSQLNSLTFTRNLKGCYEKGRDQNPGGEVV